MKVGTRVELLDDQVFGFSLPERACHGLPAGVYFVTHERPFGVTLRNVWTKARWDVTAEHVTAVTAEDGENRRSYRPLCK